MGLAVVTKAAGGLPVVDMLGVKPGAAVTEAANGYGIAVTKVSAYGVPVNYVSVGIALAAEEEEIWPRVP
jgi:hypothetical protein